MTYDAAERSVQSSRPREFFSLSINDGIQVWRHCTGAIDMVVDGVLYTAIAAARGEIAITMPGEERDLVLTLPIDHPYAVRFTQQAQPPSKTTFTMYRQNGGEVQTIWVGDVTSMHAEESIAKFRIPSRAGEYMLRSLPSALVSVSCPHMLYGSMCGVSRTGSAPTSAIAHKQTATIIQIDGLVILVNLASVTPGDAYRATWAENGEVFHAATGERATVRTQADLSTAGTLTRLTLSNVIVGLQVGHSVDIYAGCDWAALTCSGKFGNRQRYGGMPVMPTTNPFLIVGSGAR